MTPDSQDITFGEYLTKKRKQKRCSLQGLAKKAGISSSHLHNIENGLRPAPAGDKLRLIAELLEIDDVEKRVFYDLAVKTKSEACLPIDLVDYVMGDEDMVSFLRLAQIKKYTGAELLKLIGASAIA